MTMNEKDEMEITLDHIRDVKIYQSRNGYRFSVDALLLYSFVNSLAAERIADLGAGSGIIGLLLARKYPRANVSLFELQESLSVIAERNISLNSLEKRVRVIKTDLREKRSSFSRADAGSFDMVVSNPPFRKEKSGFVNPGEEKAIARHEIALKLAELVDVAYYLLKSKGRLFLIHHPARLGELVNALRDRRMEVKRLRFVHSTSSTEAKMVLVEAISGGRAGLKVEKPLIIYDETGEYTDEMLVLYGVEHKESPRR
jgi:tRNA1Val (adenine37-N6)-methyltransferase